MCKFTKVAKMLEENGINNYTIQWGAMEVQTSKHYIYMEKVASGIIVKVRQNDMFSYFVNVLVKNQNDAIGHIIGFIINSWNQEEPTQAMEKVACEVEPTIKEETQESTKKVNKMKKVVDYVKRCQFDITNMPQNTEGLEHLEFYLSEKNRVIVEKLGVYEVFLFNGKEMNRIICKNQEEVIKVVRKFAFSIEMPFNPTEEKTTKESCKTVESTTIKEEMQERPTFEESVKKINKERKRGMELIYNIITNNVKGFNKEYKNRAITRLYKYTDDMYTARFTLSYFYHDEKEKWMFTLKNHDGNLLKYDIHKSLLNEKWLLDLCKQVNDIINETK